MKFHQGLFKILRKQNVTDERTDGQTDNVKTVYPPTNTVCGVYKNERVRQQASLSFTWFGTQKSGFWQQGSNDLCKGTTEAL